MDRAGYLRLCRLLTLGKGCGIKSTFDLSWEDLAKDLCLPCCPTSRKIPWSRSYAAVRAAFPGRCHLALTLRRRPGDAARLHGLVGMAQAARVPAVFVGDVLYHTPQRRIPQDVITCIRDGYRRRSACMMQGFARRLSILSSIRYASARISRS